MSQQEELKNGREKTNKDIDRETERGRVEKAQKEDRQRKRAIWETKSRSICSAA